MVSGFGSGAWGLWFGVRVSGFGLEYHDDGACLQGVPHNGGGLANFVLHVDLVRLIARKGDAKVPEVPVPYLCFEA